MKAGWDVTRNLIVAKTGYVEEPNERRDSCRDDASKSTLVKDEDAGTQ